MKDSFFSDDLDDHDWNEMSAKATQGMRHSIRPRRVRSAKEPARSPFLEDEMEQIAPQQSGAPAQSSSDVINVPTTQPHAAPAVLTGWQDLPEADAGARRAKNKGIPVVDHARDTTSHRAFDLLRTRLRQTTLENKWTNIAVTAPTTGCGTTFTAVNLALSLSRVADSRTVLMDFNLRNPGVMDAFDMPAPGLMQHYLSGEVAMEDHLLRISDTLALGLNAAPDENAAETLQDTNTGATLQKMQDALAPELVIYDLPPMLVNDDVSAFLPQLDGVLLVSDGTQTTADQLLECERMLEGQVPLLGVVLNRARASSIPRYT